MKTIDVHAHLCDRAFDDDRKELLLTIDKEMTACICASYDLNSSKQAIALAKENSKIFAAIGIHPENVDDFPSFLRDFDLLTKEKKVVAIGEIGLDYHYFSGKSEEEVENIKAKQKEVFVRQIQLSNEHKLPIEVHCRDAMEDTLEILRKNRPQEPSLMHCFAGTMDDARELMQLGFSFSFGGISTFKNARDVQENLHEIPIENIMLETDCPYLSPEPFRGKRNDPTRVKYVADKIAKIKNLSFEFVVERTSQNAIDMFDLKV